MSTEQEESTKQEESRRRVVAAALYTEEFTPASALVRAEFGARSHRGRVQEENDDHFLVLRLVERADTILTSLASADLPSPFDEHAYAAVVADGIGHAGAGSVASRLAISTLAHLAVRFGQWNMRLNPRAAADVLERSEWLYRRTNDTILQRSRAVAELAGMAATLTGIYSVGTDLFVAHVGHSRCYLFRDGRLVRLTRDHTLEQRRATSPFPVPVGQTLGDVDHALTDAVGTTVGGPRAIVEQFRLADDDVLLLCTNGLTDVVDDNSIANVLASRRTQTEQCDLLLDRALTSGAVDNITVVIANYHVQRLEADTARPR